MKTDFLDGAALAAGDVARVAGRPMSDSERKMWTECVHGQKRSGPQCPQCLEDHYIEQLRRRFKAK
jgi:hypothetical protein